MPRRHGGLLHNLCPCLGIYLLLSAVGADQARVLVQLTRRSVDAPNNADDAAIAAAQELVVALTRYIQNTAVGGCVSLSLFINYAGRPVVIVWAVLLVQPNLAQNCMRDIRLLVQATDTQPRAMYCYVRDRTARASYSQLVEYVTKDAVQYVALHDAVLFRRQRAQRRWNAVKRLSVRVNAAAAAFREVYAHVLYQPGGRGAQEACESFQEGCESCGRCL